MPEGRNPHLQIPFRILFPYHHAVAGKQRDKGNRISYVSIFPPNLSFSSRSPERRTPRRSVELFPSPKEFRPLQWSLLLMSTPEPKLFPVLLYPFFPPVPARFNPVASDKSRSVRNRKSDSMAPCMHNAAGLPHRVIQGDVLV